MDHRVYWVHILKSELLKMRLHSLLIFLMEFSVLIWCAYSRKNRTQFREPDNNVIFERIEYQVLDRNVVVDDWLDIRSIAPNVIRLNGSATLVHPLNEIWGRGVLYYRYATYQKFLIDYKGEGCRIMNGILNGDSTNPFTKYVLENYYPLLWDDGFYTNFNYTCPVSGTMYGWHEGLNMSKLT